MKRKIASIFLMLLIAAVGVFSGCSGNKNTYIEPEPVGFEWGSDVPIAKFAHHAETMDYIDMRGFHPDLKLLMSSLKAIVNKKQPRIYTDECGYNWLDYLEIPYVKYDDPYQLILKYKDELHSVVIYDPETLETLNLACSYAGYKPSLVVSYSTYCVLQGKGLNLEVAEDYRSRFDSKMEVYNYLYESVWPHLSHKVITNLNLDVTGEIRDYAMAVGSAFVWMDVRNGEEKELFEKFYSDMVPGESAFLGWLPEGCESPMVTLNSNYGLITLHSAENLMFFSGIEAEPKVRAQQTPVLENKLYVALIVSDGDNVRFMQRDMLTRWQEGQNEFPLTWTVNPASYLLQPAVMQYYFDRATDNTGFMTGPTGLAYHYAGEWRDADGLKKILRATNKYCDLMGIRVLNNWNTGNQPWIEELSEEEMELYSSYYNSFLAVYDQAWMEPVVKNDLLFSSLTMPYTNVSDHVPANNEYGIMVEDGYDQFEIMGKDSPWFVSIQATPWQTEASLGMDMYDELKQVYDTYTAKYGDEIEFVTMDEYAMLQRQYMDISARR